MGWPSELVSLQYAALAQCTVVAAWLLHASVARAACMCATACVWSVAWPMPCLLCLLLGCSRACAGRGWAWALWEAAVPVPKGHKGPLELVCKATDESYNTQVGGWWAECRCCPHAWAGRGLPVPCR